MAEIHCLSCKETVTLGEICRCFIYANNGQQLLQRQDELDQKHVAIVVNDEYLSTSSDNDTNLCSEFQQIQIKGYENVKSPKNENNEEAILSFDLNKIRKCDPLTTKTSVKGIVQNQYGHSISSLNYRKKGAYSGDTLFNISTKSSGADYKPETEFRRKCITEQILSFNFYQQKGCEIDPFNSCDQAPCEECEMTCNKNNFPFLSLDEKLPENSLGAASQETHLECYDFSSIAKFSINTNFCSDGKNSYQNVKDQSEGNLTEPLNFPEVAAPNIHGGISQDDEVSESIESMKDANNVMGPSKDNSDFFISYKRMPSSEKTYECENSKKMSCFTKNIIVCDNSQKVISLRDQLGTHKRTYTLEKPFACNICEKRFTNKSQLSAHCRIHTKEKPFVCNKCGKGFTEKNGFVSHYRTHTREKPYNCDICKMGFIHYNSLIYHSKTHTNETPFACDFCEKRFKIRIDLVAHYRTHTVEKPYGCDMCEKRFSKKYNLVTHHRTHTGEKPYKCDMCEKKFSHKVSLVGHYRTHTGEKPYKCDICEKRFSLKASLVAHYRTHTGEKPYECDMCEKKFSHKVSLVAHYRTHTGEKPYECDMCEKKFSHKVSLVAHYRTHKVEKLGV